MARCGCRALGKRSYEQARRRFQPRGRSARTAPSPAGWPSRSATLERDRRPVVRLGRQRSSTTMRRPRHQCCPAGQGDGRHHTAQPQRLRRPIISAISNKVLWPVVPLPARPRCDSRPPIHRRLPPRQSTVRAITLAPLLAPDDIIWVHDYHLIPLAAELRVRGMQAPHRFLPAHPVPAAGHAGGGARCTTG